MQQPMNTNAVQVVVVTQPGVVDKESLYSNMKTGLAKQLIGLGIMQLLIGIFCISLQGVSLWVYLSGRSVSGVDFIGHGFWTGLLFSITGSIGIAGAVKRSKCQVVAYNVLSILSASFAAILICISIPGAVDYAFGGSYCEYFRYAYYISSCYNLTEEMGMTGIAMQATTAILAFIEGIIAIWSSAICCTIGACCCDCGGSCCCPPSHIQNQFAMTGQPFTSQQLSASNLQPQIFIPNQKQEFLPNLQHPSIFINSDPRQQLVQNGLSYNNQQIND